MKWEAPDLWKNTVENSLDFLLTSCIPLRAEEASKLEMPEYRQMKAPKSDLSLAKG